MRTSKYFIVRVLSACVVCTLPHLGIRLIFFLSINSIYQVYLLSVAVISGVAFFVVVLLYPVR